MITTTRDPHEEIAVIPSLLSSIGPLVRGGVYLMDGGTGSGKSTFLLKVAGDLVEHGYKVLYVCGEEDAAQVTQRARRIGVEGEIGLCTTPILGMIAQDAESYEADVLIVDSVQSVRALETEGVTGGAAQIRTAADFFYRFAKEKNIATILVAQQTNEGRSAGGSRLRHTVDTTFTIISDGIYRGVFSNKNRFGKAGQMYFAINEKGLTIL